MKKYINDIYNKTLDVIKDVLNDYRFIYTLFSGLIFGVIAHGMMIFNKYSFFDDVGYFNNVGLMFPLGRWGLWFVQLCAYHLLGTKHVSNSTFNGVLSIIFIIFTVYTLVRLLNIKKKHLIVLLTGLFVSYPTVASAFGYMFTAPYYFFGTFIGVLGLSIYSKNKNIIKFIICISLLALGTGLYQANIPVYIATMLLIMYVNVSNKDINIKDFILEGFNYVLVCISFMIEYILINNILLKVFNQSLESARGVNSFGLTSVSGYISRILTAYKEFISPTTSSNGSGAVFAYSNFYYHILLVIVGLLLVVNLLKKVDNTKRIELIIILILLPLASYFVYVMCGIEYVHSLMMYGFLMMFVLLILLLENIQAGGGIKECSLNTYRFNDYLQY